MSMTLQEYNPKRIPAERLEVFSMWFQNLKDDGGLYSRYDYWRLHCSADEINVPEKKRGNECWVLDKRFRVKREEHPSDFKGRIFIYCGQAFHEIYNSIKEGSLYTDLRLRDTNEEQMQESVDDTKKKTLLPVMGPHAEFNIAGRFVGVVHRDSGDASIDESYVATADPLYFKGCGLRCDDWDEWLSRFKPGYNKPMLFSVGGAFNSLVLDCAVFNDSKAIHVEVKWVRTDADATDTKAAFICGELAISNIDDKKSILFKTPPNKAQMVSLGDPIPLLKSVVAVPYHADFTFMANLGCPNNADESSKYFPFVNGCLYFQDASIKDEAFKSSESCKLINLKRSISGVGGYILVEFNIDVQ